MSERDEQWFDALAGQDRPANAADAQFQQALRRAANAMQQPADQLAQQRLLLRLEKEGLLPPRSRKLRPSRQWLPRLSQAAVVLLCLGLAFQLGDLPRPPAVSMEDAAPVLQNVPMRRQIEPASKSAPESAAPAPVPMFEPLAKQRASNAASALEDRDRRETAKRDQHKHEQAEQELAKPMPESQSSFAAGASLGESSARKASPDSLANQYDLAGQDNLAGQSRMAIATRVLRVPDVTASLLSLQHLGEKHQGVHLLDSPPEELSERSSEQPSAGQLTPEDKIEISVICQSAVDCQTLQTWLTTQGDNSENPPAMGVPLRLRLREPGIKNP